MAETRPYTSVSSIRGLGAAFSVSGPWCLGIECVLSTNTVEKLGTSETTQKNVQFARTRVRLEATQCDIFRLMGLL